MKTIVKRFFAVTATDEWVSVYRISCSLSPDGIPESLEAKKVSLIQVGNRVGAEPKVKNEEDIAGHAQFIGVSRWAIVCYVDYHAGERGEPLPFEHLGHRFILRSTSQVKALFLNEGAANRCAISIASNPPIGYGLQPEFRQQTEDTLHAIGDHHPVFIVSKSETYRFSYAD